MPTHGTFAHGSLALLAGSLLVLACGNPFETKHCTLMGCTSGAGGTLEAPLPLEALHGTRLEVCRNDQCSSANLFVREYGESKPEFELTCSTVLGNAGLMCTPALGGTTSASTVLQIQYLSDDIAAGDRFVVRLTDASAEKVYVSREATLQGYREVHPNGEECDGDYFCRAGSF